MHCCANRCIGSAPSATHWRTETGVAFACSCACGVETAIASAGAKWAFWVRFSAAEVPLVASSPRHSCLCAKKFALLGPMVGASAKKFALRTKNSPKLAVCGALGEFIRENTAGGVAPGEVFRGTAAERSALGEFCRTTTQVRPLLGGRHLRSNREPTCWDHHERMGMKKALPKECLVEMQNPHRWIAPRGAAARPKGLEPPTF